MSIKTTENVIGVTGADGFIGKHLLKLLSKNNEYRIVAFQGDLLNEKDIENFYAEGVTTVVHLAGGFFGSFNDLININLVTTQNILVIGKKFGLRKIIYSSSGAVYGNTRNLKSYENDNLCPNTDYGFTKTCAENLIKMYSDGSGLEYIILRFPNVYGEDNNKGVIFNFLKGIRDNGKVTVYGDGSAVRDFLYVDDACRAIVASLNYPNSDIFNISGISALSINDLLQILSSKYTFEVVYENANNALTNLTLNTSKAEKLLKFTPIIIKIDL